MINNICTFINIIEYAISRKIYFPKSESFPTQKNKTRFFTYILENLLIILVMDYF